MDTFLDEYRSVWEELRRRGNEPTPEELCRGRPDRVDEVRRRIEVWRGAETLPFAPDAPRAEPASSEGRVVLTIECDLKRLHGRGGLGEVFLARDEKLDRDLALKCVKLGARFSPEARARFAREALVTSRLEHPAIVPIHGVARLEDGSPCYAMRFIQGKTLGEAIEELHSDPPRGDWTLRGLLGRFVTVCNAVAYAHSRKVLHRDLKPSNIMLGSFGETLLLDWGLAKILDVPPDGDEAELAMSEDFDADDLETQADVVLGTPAFMSPEQARGAGSHVGPASDVYGLGATLYAVLVGRTPFAGKPGVELAADLIEGRFPRPREIKRDVPRPLEAIALKAMALDPRNRYASAEELAADLQRWLDDEPVRARRETIGERIRRFARRRPATATWILLAIVCDFLVLVPYINFGWLKRFGIEWIVPTFLAAFLVSAPFPQVTILIGAGIGAVVGRFQGSVGEGAKQGVRVGFRLGVAFGMVLYILFVIGGLLRGPVK